jgi:hypothetical protein
MNLECHPSLAINDSFTAITMICATDIPDNENNILSLTEEPHRSPQLIAFLVTDTLAYFLGVQQRNCISNHTVKPEQTARLGPVQIPRR